MLLVALGDGGSGGDPENRASDLTQLLGKILRLDVLGADVAGGEPYAIPAHNPYAARPEARPEILHSGLRNPFRSAVTSIPRPVDRDVGPFLGEVDVARAGSPGSTSAGGAGRAGTATTRPRAATPTA